MKRKTIPILVLTLALMASMAVSASAADYSFTTDPKPDYYGSTNYEDLYDAGYNYGARNQIDYDIPELKYGLSQEFLESSLNNPYLSSGIQYGIGGGSGTFGVGNRLAAEMVLEIFKTIRAYSGSGICATQDLNDFFSLDNGKYGKGIINNCRTKVILNLEDEEAQRVQQVLHLSEAEVMEITHFERGNGLISSNNNNITVEFKASPLERDLITTDRRELLDLLQRIRQQGA